MISGAAYVVKALQEENVEILFNYPGAATIDIMDELYKQDQVKVILPRHEQALAHAADGYARSTGKVGVCMVTSGPGATNLVTGIATAYSDSVPMVCITGQVDLALMGNDAFQEVDTVGIVRNVSKYAVTVRDRKDLGRILKEAFYIARTGRPGPVVVDIPKNIQKAMGSDVYPDEVNIRGYKPNTTVHIGQVKKACSVIAKAKRPLFLLGGGISISGANELMTQLVDKTGIPVVTTLMGKGAISSRHPLYLGNVGIHGGYAPNVAITDCDVMISIGTRFNDRITGKLSTFAQNCKIVHIDVDAASISKNIKVDIPIVADAKLAIEALLEYIEPHDLGDWPTQLQQLKEERPVTQAGEEGLTPQNIIDYINNHYDRPGDNRCRSKPIVDYAIPRNRRQSSIVDIWWFRYDGLWIPCGYWCSIWQSYKTRIRHLWGWGRANEYSRICNSYALPFACDLGCHQQWLSWQCTSVATIILR